MNEIWEDIKGYPNYEVSNLGRVKNKNRNKIIKNFFNKGYKLVSLNKNNKRKTFRLHRLVAEAFIPNPDNLPQVNHKDEDKTNNRVDNLEWCTHDYNSKYGTRGKRISENVSGYKHHSAKKVLCIETGEIFECCRDAEKKIGVARCSVSKAANPKQEQQTSGGYHWKYIE